MNVQNNQDVIRVLIADHDEFVLDCYREAFSEADATSEMQVLDAMYPGYGLAQHKGYPSRMHIEALQLLGASPVHRRSYAPVRRVLEEPR